MMMKMVGAFAEFERSILRERTMSGLDAAPKQGRIGGRRPNFDPTKKKKSSRWYAKASADAARLFNVHPSDGFAAFG
jgi:DNA invertase Pin-like site-specific DNA recombinase